MIKFGYTILYVTNVEKSIAFYEKSFDFKRKFVTPENDYGELETGQTTIAFASLELGNSNLKKGFLASKQSEKPFGMEIVLVTDLVQAAIDKAIANGGILVENPVQKPWGQTVGYIRDLDGFLLEICTPVGN